MSEASTSAIGALDVQKYQNPIPNRDFIINLLNKRNKKLNRSQLAKALKLSCSQQKEGLRRRLNAMVRDGQIVYDHPQGYIVFKQKELLTGQVTGHPSGYGFVTFGARQDDVFLNHNQMCQAFDGDTVEVLVSPLDQRGRREGIIVNIVKHNTTELVGRLRLKGEQYFLEPENSRITNPIQVTKGRRMGAKDGQYVVVNITQYPSKHKTVASAQVTEVLGDIHSPGLEIDVAIRNHNIPHRFPTEVLQAAKCIAPEVAQADRIDRVDLTCTPFITIDGEDARDFDDAVYCQRAGEGWRLSVAIADVSHYVLPDSALDEEAQKRGTSIYFPQRVVPMLPEVLSNGLCSLNPNVDRLAIVCEMTFNRSGKMTTFHFCQAVIRSHARLTYGRVNSLLTASESLDSKQMRQEYPKIHANIHELHRLYGVLSKARAVRGAVDFETTETHYQFNEQRKIDQIIPLHRNDAHRMIEECMLCANVATAQFLQQRKVPALYRTHSGPQQSKLSALRVFLAGKGLKLAGGNEPQPKDYQRLLNRAAARADAKVIQLMLLRSLGQAQYNEDNQGHFGLAYSAYVHFTSPIRRYPDLLVHRAIRAEINRQDKPGLFKRLKQLLMLNTGNSTLRLKKASPSSTNISYPYDRQALQAIAEHCSAASRRADKASSEVENWLECEYMSKSVGKTFIGSISNICNFGLFVTLADTQIECLVYKNTLDPVDYCLDADKHRLIDKSKGMDLSLGDNVRIQINRINMAQRQIECQIVSD